MVSRRLFLALWPDQTVRTQLAKIADSIPGGRKVPVANLHLTLVFLGATEPRQQALYEAVIDNLPVPPISLHLDHLGCWPKTGILWFGSKHAELAIWVNELKQRLAECGLKPERRPFRAHITLARKYFHPPLEFPKIVSPVIWRPNGISLLVSELQSRGAHYRIIRHWPTAQ